MLITIVTPTYNRSKTLAALYESLCNQTSNAFKWLIIDDGSKDNTETLINSFIKDNQLTIRYIKKENGGKHSALNVAFRNIDTELLFIVDSDDTLLPYAVETITNDWLKVKSTSKTKRPLCGIGYLRGYAENQNIGDLYSQDYFVSDFITERYNKKIDGDKAEVWATAFLKGFQFPEYPGERFISESVAWIYLAKKYDMLFVNKIIYLTEYLPGGLSQVGRSLRFKCPELMAYGSLATMSSEFSLQNRLKQTLLFIVYSKFGRKNFLNILKMQIKIKQKQPQPMFTVQERVLNCFLIILCYLPGLLLYRFWKKKYL